ncbi:MAG: GNAT family N-acetyltransferase [Streptomyces sp.]|nr:GNAT family N-acetyltransferase [Streptomyces sp.]NUS10044.1 GNAT family N-acetyltransferase [Streptomyces sp.]
MSDAEGNDARDSVSLRPIGEDDLPVITGHLADPGSVSPFQWFGWSDPHRWRRDWAENGLLGPDGGRLLVTGGGESLGFVAWRKISSANSFFWNVGILLWPHARGRGVGTEAQRLLVRYLFAHTPTARVEADTDIDNVAEQRALEKAGFTREGVLRASNFRDGRWRDSVLYGIVRDDLPTAGA